MIQSFGDLLILARKHIDKLNKFQVDFLKDNKEKLKDTSPAKWTMKEGKILNEIYQRVKQVIKPEYGLKAKCDLCGTRGGKGMILRDIPNSLTEAIRCPMCGDK